MESRCLACNDIVDIYLDEELCPVCYEAYLDNFNDILPGAKDE